MVLLSSLLHFLGKLFAAFLFVLFNLFLYLNTKNQFECAWTGRLHFLLLDKQEKRMQDWIWRKVHYSVNLKILVFTTYPMRKWHFGEKKKPIANKQTLRQWVKIANKPPSKTVLLSQCKWTDDVPSYSSWFNSVSETESHKQFLKRVSKCIQLIQLHWEIKKSPTPANDFERCIKADWHCKYRKSITGVKRGAIN